MSVRYIGIIHRQGANVLDFDYSVGATERTLTPLFTRQLGPTESLLVYQWRPGQRSAFEIDACEIPNILAEEAKKPHGRGNVRPDTPTELDVKLHYDDDGYLIGVEVVSPAILTHIPQTGPPVRSRDVIEMGIDAITPTSVVSAATNGAKLVNASGGVVKTPRKRELRIPARSGGMGRRTGKK